MLKKSGVWFWRGNVRVKWERWRRSMSESEKLVSAPIMFMTILVLVLVCLFPLLTQIIFIFIYASFDLNHSLYWPLSYASSIASFPTLSQDSSLREHENYIPHSSFTTSPIGCLCKYYQTILYSIQLYRWLADMTFFKEYIPSVLRNIIKVYSCIYKHNSIEWYYFTTTYVVGR